ncbi:CD209 antigen-like protein E [Sinocyclocheilus grahami]|uniref:CD209 antigen-like protein E n=1 Tax=Sinocyclocheilus grahami TaxID=75366 RepID=UPI0007ACB619|nr:PREDICTED: CD209 antigen-like protein E [Sinocyclocheilus grahami]
MELEDFYNNAKCRNVKNTTGSQRHCTYEGKAQSCRGNRCLVPITVCLGIICLLLIAGIILQHFQATSKRGYLWGPDGLFLSTELKSWSDSRQYCRDRGADLVIINTEEKQRHISSFIKERVWIGLSDTEIEGIMKWVDNSPLNQGFWRKSEPNNYGGNEDCIELNFKREETGWSPLNSWNDVPCSEKKKGICEK